MNWEIRLGALRIPSAAVAALLLPAALWISAAIALLHGRLLWTIIDGAPQIPALISGPQATVLFDRHDRPVFSLHDEARIDVHLEQVSPHLVAAVLAVEDQRFYSHHGLDAIRIAGAAWANLRAGRIVEGGSTITQQLARRLSLGPERTWRRKIREALAATDIEAQHTKRAILETYLNNIYLGDGYYGVEAASRGYFGKPASALTPSEAAVIAGQIRSPAQSPRLYRAKALARRNVALRRMRETGAVDAAGFRAALATPMTVKPRTGAALARLSHGAGDDDSSECGLYFYEEVQKQLVSLFGWERVSRGGLRVYTTIDPELQRDGERAIRGRLAEIGRLRRHGADLLQGALAAIDPRDGSVLALVGGRDAHRSRYNRATEARRQPGSAFKPIIFAAALEQGFGPGSLLQGLDAPIEAGRDWWLPSGEHEAQTYTLRRALKVSSNRASAQLLQRVGVSSALLYAARLGITSRLPAVPSLALGTGDVTLLELTSAYGTFANHGMWHAPTVIRRVEDRDGVVLWEPPIRMRQAVRPSTAYLMSSMLSDVIEGGTGYLARGVLKRPAAGKTGTSDDYADAWFVGYTPRLVAGVWIGLDRPAPIMRRGFGGIVSAPAWARFMARATAADPVEWFDAPPDIERVTLCRRTGLRATEGCRAPVIDDSATPIGILADGALPVPIAAQTAGVYEDLFAIGTGPAALCPLHGAGLAETFGSPVGLTQALFHPIPRPEPETRN